MYCGTGGDVRWDIMYGGTRGDLCLGLKYMIYQQLNCLGIIKCCLVKHAGINIMSYCTMSFEANQ